MNYSELMLTKQSIMDQLNDVIYSLNEGTREGLTFEDIKFMKSIIIVQRYLQRS